MNVKKRSLGYAAVVAVTALVTIGIVALLMNILERKTEGRTPYALIQEVDDDTTDPEQWGVNWPRQFDSYKLTAIATRTRFGGHGGSEALPEQKIERDPWLKRMFDGYAFSIDYRDRRGHAYMLEDQENTLRLTKPQSGSCLHCHASIMPLYRQLGDGDAAAGLEKTYQMSYEETNALLRESGHANPVSCVDCHTPNTMEIRVTRPAFIEGIRSLANSEAPVPQMPSIERWRATDRAEPYDPNKLASLTEMRSFVCGQCHVEYYCASAMPLEYPWTKGLRAEDLEAHWNETSFPDGSRFFDFRHAESGAEILKAQHPEFELWSQGVHARAGVACADCHMPYQRDGATKVSDHWVRSPLLNIDNACQTCHRVDKDELLARVDAIQGRNFSLLQRAGDALMDQLDAINAARQSGATDAELAESLELQRKAQWRLDFIAAENSMGFHAPQEAARILGEAADYARQGQVEAMRKQK
ncbi:MAG TPA: ammonia-forming cytochrome c nitrite reductase subunit c552 [Rhodothermales bacterium]|nr:ammonia-forming cytochrome c nitrite reductase subunit c552 [Rhodothermales bacterium]